MGGLCGGYLGGKYGPRKTCQLHGLLCSIGWIVLALSPHLSSIIIARILLGFGTSLNTANCSLLVARLGMYGLGFVIRSRVKHLLFHLDRPGILHLPLA